MSEQILEGAKEITVDEMIEIMKKKVEAEEAEKAEKAE